MGLAPPSPSDAVRRALAELALAAATLDGSGSSSISSGPHRLPGPEVRVANVVPISAKSRRLRAVRKKTISSIRTTNRELRHLRLLTDEDLAHVGQVTRPKNRSECRDGLRPCPFVSCKHHLYLDVSPRTQSLVVNFPDLAPEDMPADESCALDVADAGGATLEKVGDVMNLTRERVRQLEVRVLGRSNVRQALAPHADDPHGKPPDIRVDGGLSRAKVDHFAEEPDENAGDDGEWTRERIARAAIWRVYERECFEREGHRRDKNADRAQRGDHVVDDEEIERWSNEVLAELRAGTPLREAMKLASRDVAELGGEGVPAGFTRQQQQEGIAMSAKGPNEETAALCEKLLAKLKEGGPTAPRDLGIDASDGELHHAMRTLVAQEKTEIVGWARGSRWQVKGDTRAAATPAKPAKSAPPPRPRASKPRTVAAPPKSNGAIVHTPAPSMALERPDVPAGSWMEDLLRARDKLAAKIARIDAVIADMAE